MRGFKTRNNRKQRKIAAGIAIRKKGRPPKDFQVSEEDKIAQLRYIVDRKDAKIKSLEMKNELMREFGESLTDCALREVKEESGLDVVIKDIIGTSTDPNIRVAFSDGEVRKEFTVVYYGEALNYNVSLDDESSQFEWVSLDKILDLPRADSQRRIQDAIEYLNSGTRKML